MIMRDTPPDIMNMLQRTILLLYAYDADAEDRSAHHEIHTAISLISRLPRIMVLTYYAKQARYNNGSMIMHRFIPGQSTAETILSMLRPIASSRLRKRACWTSCCACMPSMAAATTPRLPRAC